MRTLTLQIVREFKQHGQWLHGPQYQCYSLAGTQMLVMAPIVNSISTEIIVFAYQR